MTKVGLFGIGLDTCWGQFEGLLDIMSIPKEIRKSFSMADIKTMNHNRLL